MDEPFPEESRAMIDSEHLLKQLTWWQYLLKDSRRDSFAGWRCRDAQFQRNWLSLKPTSGWSAGEILEQLILKEISEESNFKIGLHSDKFPEFTSRELDYRVTPKGFISYRISRTQLTSEITNFRGSFMGDFIFRATHPGWTYQRKFTFRDNNTRRTLWSNFQLILTM